MTTTQRVRPKTEPSGRPFYQPEGLRERLFFQLLCDMDLARADEKWPIPSTPPTDDSDQLFADMVDKRLRNIAKHASSGEAHAIQFAAAVWGNKTLIKAVGPFNLVEAFTSLDDEKRETILVWCEEPWLA